MDKILSGKTAIVTGGSRGIGFAIAKKFVECGALVEIWGINQERGDIAAQELSQLGGHPVTFSLIDVANHEGVSQGVQEFLAKHQKIDVLVNNAGITRDNLLMRMSDQEWDSVIHTNLSSLYYTCSSVMRPMIKARSGSIINISSVVGLMGSPGQTNYAAAKAGIIGFSRSLAKEVSSKNIRVNVIAPGFVDTNMTQVLNESLKAEWMKNIPLGRMGTPEEIANTALFFASSFSSYITGQVLSVDGGLTY